MTSKLGADIARMAAEGFGIEDILVELKQRGHQYVTRHLVKRIVFAIAASAAKIGRAHV